MEKQTVIKTLPEALKMIKEKLMGSCNHTFSL